MEINIPTDVVVSELMKNYYTKEEVTNLVEKAKKDILSFITANAKVVFTDSIYTDTTTKKTTRKSPKKAKTEVVEAAPPQISSEDEKLFEQNVSQLTFPEEVPVETSSEVQPVEKQVATTRSKPSPISPDRPSLDRSGSRPAGRVAVQPKNAEKYEYLNIDPLRFPTA